MNEEISLNVNRFSRLDTINANKINVISSHWKSTVFHVKTQSIPTTLKSFQVNERLPTSFPRPWGRLSTTSPLYSPRPNWTASTTSFDMIEMSNKSFKLWNRIKILTFSVVELLRIQWNKCAKKTSCSTKTWNDFTFTKYLKYPILVKYSILCFVMYKESLFFSKNLQRRKALKIFRQRLIFLDLYEIYFILEKVFVKVFMKCNVI